MPTPEQLAGIKLLATSPDELAYFFDQLTSADWLPILRDDGLLGHPPEPIEQGNGVMFPFWPASRYMVRIAPDAPGAVADALWLARVSRNPRVWWDTVDALVQMPPEHAVRFIPFIKIWVHHPWRLGLETSAAKLVHHLIANGAGTPAIELARALASLLPPADWPEADPWVVLDEYDYGKEIPPIGRSLAAFGPAGPNALVEELEAFLAVKHPERENGRAYDYSFIWRPAIEDHEQNWDFDREAKLVVAIRDGYEDVLTRCPGEASAVVTTLLDSAWPIVRRIGLHLLVSNGDDVPVLVGDVLTNRGLLAEDHHRHEFYRVLTRRFGLLSHDAQAEFVANVRSIADDAAALSATRGTDVDPELIRKVVLRRWLTPVAEHLDDAGRADLEYSMVGTGEDSHPDFPSYHMSWMGSTSPVALEDLRKLTAEEVLTYLATWEEPQGLGPRHPSTEGLAQQLIELVAEAPDTFVPLGPRFLSLKPAYFDGYLNGLMKALQSGRAFAWEPVLVTCRLAIEKVDAASSEEVDSTWGTARMAIIRLIEKGLDSKTSEIAISEADRIWDLISVLVEDPDPTPADEARFGPPNMDPNTYSLNTIRGMAFHSLFTYLLWHHRQMERPASWSISERDPKASDILDAHLNPDRDPSVAVRAAYGWWLPYMLDLDADWVRDRADRMVDRIESNLARACWEGFLFRSNPTRLALGTFAEAYASYAEQLASLDVEPEAGHRPADPIHLFIDHLVKAWLWNRDMRELLPLRTLLASGKAWLVATVIEEAGQLIGRTDKADIAPELDAAYRDLWDFVLESAANLDVAGLRKALASFAWWFGSDLSGEWTLPQLLQLLDHEVKPDPDYGIFRRLPSLAADHPDETLRVIEKLADEPDEPWTLQVHENEIRQVLEVSIHSSNDYVRARAEALVHRLGRIGLGGLASLLRG